MFALNVVQMRKTPHWGTLINTEAYQFELP